MKLLYKISLIVNLLLIAGCIYLAINGKQLIRDYFFKYVIEVRHQQKLSMFKATPVSNGAIVFVGNSITEGGNWSELFPDKHILNRGIGGDVSDGVLKRLRQIVHGNPKLEPGLRFFVNSSLAEALSAVDDFMLLSPEQRYLKFVKKNPALLNRLPIKYIANVLGITPVSLSRIRKRISTKKQ